MLLVGTPLGESADDLQRSAPSEGPARFQKPGPGQPDTARATRDADIQTHEIVDKHHAAILRVYACRARVSPGFQSGSRGWAIVPSR